MSLPFASIDLGTNSARLLIGSVDSPSHITPLFVKRAITRLGGGFSKAQGLSSEARERSLVVLREFADEIRDYGAVEVRAAATSAVRDAVNGKDFVDEVSRETGLRLEVIDGREEGLLTLRGIFSGIRKENDCFVFDIGGGSTEYTLAREAMSIFTRSLPLGVVRLKEGKGHVSAMEDKIRSELDGFCREMEAAGYGEFPSGAEFIGTAGTPTTLAAIDLGLADCSSRSVQGYRLSLDRVRNIYSRLLPLTPEEALLVPGVKKGREDLLVAGILITIRTMERFGFENLIVSETGLLEGLLLSLQYPDTTC